MKVIVTGMHRSGTSMMSMVMGLLGFEIGKNFSIWKPPDNPLGYFEDLDFKKINRTIMRLNKCGRGSFGKLYPCQETYKGHREMTKFLQKWRKVKNASWKDPRACLTIHLWAKKIPGLKVIFMTRPHIEIAYSLKKRNRIPIKRGLALAGYYSKEFMKHKKTLDWMPVAYHGFFESTCVDQLFSICDFLGIDHPNQKTIDQIFDLVTPEHWHQQQGI